MAESPKKLETQNEAEYSGSLWKHPYFLYIVLTIVLFLFLGLAGWLAWKNDWIPHR